MSVLIMLRSDWLMEHFEIPELQPQSIKTITTAWATDLNEEVLRREQQA